MLITIKNKQPDGTMDFDLSMSEAECNFLVNFAIESLLQIGSVAVDTNVEGPQEVEIPTISRTPNDTTLN